MAEYIEREKLLDALYDADAITMRGVEILNQFPAADVRPVVRGRWIESRSVLGTTTGGTTIYYGYECSVCGGLMGRKGDAFCYKCGARMDGDGE